MKRRLLATSCTLFAFMLVLSLAASAQQRGRTAKPRDNSSLEASLEQLGRALKGSVVFDSGVRYARRTVSLKRRNGCEISFQAMKYPRSTVNEVRDQSSLFDFSYWEWKLNLSDLDPAAVTVERAAIGDHRVVRFAALAGKEAIRLEGYGTRRVEMRAEGSIDVSEKNATQAATALREAIIACRD